MYHVGVLFPLLINFLWSLYLLRFGLTASGLVTVLTAAALLLMFFSLRAQILTVQDRVIRLEMRHRLRDVMPADVYAQAVGLPTRQLVALRFAGDSELPALVRDVLSGSLSTGKEIKMRVKDWQADYLRA
jgi:hypothetical protein